MVVKNNPALMKQTAKALSDLQNVIENMDEHRGRTLLHWLSRQNNYLQWEVGFNPKKNKNYKRGEVVHINFGFNVGSEHGGPHWGVILDDNKWSSPTAIVIPLGSLDDGKGEADVHTDDVYLGQIPSINDKLVYALPTQIRTVSKLRITSPRTTKDDDHYLTNAQLDLIDNKMVNLFFSKSKAIQEMQKAHSQVAGSTVDEQK
ncbi:type II toxin-antitoxin system PemK/MazF family toxin [Paenibacillus sp. PR3]|uniref:Type II toxin-antitoxin system PemK/MazF family toxin n=1 Tax=Paenibacillus terricola TaxID=2763503 RepID=A0ABR8N603_9BACL|nr:type II toxin-antitoxin system PemK/MazF family toxin [Paenibacillus terricola]MBD3922981.1 type II toxin-antitoxin system PemK/MazF family toxin [Paenibacillus terricola]